MSLYRYMWSTTTDWRQTTVLSSSTSFLWLHPAENRDLGIDTCAHEASEWPVDIPDNLVPKYCSGWDTPIIAIPPAPVERGGFEDHVDWYKDPYGSARLVNCSMKMMMSVANDDMQWRGKKNAATTSRCRIWVPVHHWTLFNPKGGVCSMLPASAGANNA